MATDVDQLVDAENGRISRRIFIEWYLDPLNYEMGLGHERFDEDLKAWASDYRFSESNHRRFYQRWARLMAGETWAEVKS